MAQDSPTAERDKETKRQRDREASQERALVRERHTQRERDQKERIGLRSINRGD